jgi:hypothetical protein
MKISITGILLAVAALSIAGFGIYIWRINAVEQPAYETVSQDGNFEVRDYPSLVAAEVVRFGSRRDAVYTGFRPLAAYIFASERPGEKIAMTAPVTQQSGQGTSEWSIRFIMPSKLSLQSLPRPENTEVKLVDIPAQRRAAVRFSGVADDVLLEEKTNALRAWMRSRGLTSQGAPTFAYYNHPLTPGFLRRNEVLFDLEAAPAR